MAASAVLACLAPLPLHAIDKFWIDSAGGSFGDIGNWDNTEGGPGGDPVPGVADIANFTLNSTYTVTFAAGVTNTDLDVEDGNVTFDLDGFTYTLTDFSGAITIGNIGGQTGRLTVRDGTLGVDNNGDEVYVGFSNSGTGFLTISTGGRLGTAALRPDIYVGVNNVGTLTVNDNGRIDGEILSLGVNNSSTAGTVAITGPNAVANISSNTFIGANGAGTLTVTNGGMLTSTGGAFVGNSLGSDGAATVSGAGSLWTMASTITIGNSGDGALTISSGGLVSSTSTATLGNSTTGFGTATVSGTNSRWNLSAGQTIGGSGLGVMTVSSGGQVVSSSSATLGSSAGGEGRVTVAGAGARWALGSTLTVGQSGTGDLTVSGGGEVSSSSLSIGNNATGIGVVTVTGAGSKLTTGGVFLAFSGTGTLNVTSGAEVHATTVSVDSPGGTLNLNGGSIFVGSNFLNANVFNFTDGLLRVEGIFQASAAAAQLTINGADSGDLPTLDLIGIGPTSNVTSLVVGLSERGQLLLRQGRVLNLGINNVAIGLQVGSEGSISVQSGAQLLTSANLDVGGSGATAGGAGTLDISGGTVDAGALRFHRDGTINLSSGTLAMNTLPVLDGQFNWTGGTLRFDAATVLDSTNAPKLLGLDGTVSVGQTLASATALTLQTPVVVNGGTLSPSSLVNQSTLEIRSGSASVTGTTTNSAGGQIFVQRDLTLGGALTNAGGSRIDLTDGTGRLLGAGTIANSGLVTGDGTITNTFNNNAGGEVRGEFGKTLYFTGATGANAGRLNLLGGTLSFAQQFTNSATGQINGEGVLYFPTTPVPSNASPTAGLMNAGNINLTGGDSQIYGTVQMQAGSRLIVSGGATASFFDVFRHSGIEVRASAGSNIVFFGEVRGAGSVTGTGTIYFEGAYSPGNSPASVTLGTDVIFGDANALTLEIGGLVAGSEYDQLIVGLLGSLALDGELVLDLIDGFVPAFGDTFQVFDFDPGQVSGAFDEITIADPLPGDLAFDTSSLSTAGTITVVPEPGAGALLASAALLGVRRRRSRTPGPEH